MPVEEMIRQYGYWMVFAGTLLQGDATVVAASFLTHRGYLDLGLVSLTTGLATVLENEGYYELARWKRRPPLSSSSPKFVRISQVLDWVRRRGSLVLLVSRFLPGLRLAIALACGASRMSRVRFFLVNSAGAVMWVAAMEGIGYSSGQLFAHLLVDVKHHEWTAAVILALTVMLLVALGTRGRVIRDVAAMLREPGVAVARSIDRLAKALNSPNRFWAFLR